ncbi:type VI secretion system baseplate subunit TssF [Chelatococcus sp. GCM10030263]|uniref:type VI secretion system baseplate subunit TssF n=1 Tax=Chelatococcus sp. GCM10030263 TaxID=3273387 RepID=UPI0036097012
MTDDFLFYYNEELAHLRHRGAEFAAEHPKVASRLRLSPDAIEDPFVGRLMEGFAFLTARLRQKLDDDLPELTETVLDLLYPHLLAPVPSTAILSFSPRPDLAEPYQLKAGTEIDSEAIEGERCRFRSIYPVTLAPLIIGAAHLGSRAMTDPVPQALAGARGLLHLSLARPPGAAEAPWPDRLRFFLRGPAQQAHRLYEMLLNDAVAVAFRPKDGDGTPVDPIKIAGADCITPVGFGADEGLLPYPRGTLLGYRLLCEYFACPDKFMFVDIALPPGLAGRGLDLAVHLSRWPADLERHVSADSFALGCTPVVNLFPRTAEPLLLDHGAGTYRVVADARRPEAFEIYRVLDVRATRSDGTMRRFRPFFTGEPGEGFWRAARRPAPRGEASEVYLTLADPGGRPSELAGAVLGMDCLCFNRNLPAQLPFGGGRPDFTLAEGQPVRAITCLTPPSPVLRRGGSPGGQWRLMSHLALNHLSLSDEPDAVAVLREILALHDLRVSAETLAAIEGLVALTVVPGVARVPGPHAGAFCRGLDVTLRFDEQRFSGAGPFLLASVLDRFLGLYCSVNSFTRTSLATSSGEIVKRWPARAGDRVLL